MDIVAYVAFGIVGTCMAISCVVLCTCAYLKIHMDSEREFDGDFSDCVPRRSSGETEDYHRDSFGFSSVGGGPLSSISPNVSSSSWSGSGRSYPGNQFMNSILIFPVDEGCGVLDGGGNKECGGDNSIANDVCDDGRLGDNGCSDMGGGGSCEGGQDDGGGDCGE